MPRSTRLLTPLALMVLTCAALAYAYFVDRGTVSDLDRQVRAREVFPMFQLDLVQRVELSHGPEMLVLERPPGAGAAWAITSPRHEVADPTAVDSLLRELELAKRLRTVSEEARFGDIRVRGRILIGRVQYAFTLAGDAPAPQGGAYMRLEGEPPFVVETSLKVQLLRTSDAYRVRSLVRYPPSEIARVERTGGTERLTLERVGETFRIGGAAGLRASRSALERLFGALAELRADSFLEDGDADRIPAHMPRDLVIVPRDGAAPHLDLSIGGACPTPPGEVVIARVGASRTSACVAKGALEPFEATAEDLLDKTILFARADEIEEMDLSSSSPGDPRLNLARRGTGWHLRAPQDRDLTPDEVDAANTLLIAIAGAQASTVRAPADGERLTARTRATFIRTGAGSSETVEMALPDSTGVVLARRADDGAILQLSRAVARRFEPHPVALRSRALWPAPFDPVNVVAVDDNCTPEPERLELVDGRWTLRAPAGHSVDVAYTMDLVESLAHAKVDGWIAEKDDGTFGIGTSKCRVTMTLAPQARDGGTGSRSIVFGSQDESGTYASTLETEPVSLLPSSLRELALHPAIDRSRFRIEATPGARATLSHDRARVLLLSDGGAFSRPGRAETGDDPLGAALVAFYARNAVHVGPPAPAEGFDRPTLEIQLEGRGEGAARRIAIGAPTGEPDESYFARVSGVDATFAVSTRTVEALLAGW